MELSAVSLCFFVRFHPARRFALSVAVVFLSVWLVIVVGIARAGQDDSSDIPDSFSELVGLLNQNDLTLADWARATCLASSYFAGGPAGVSSSFNHFLKSSTPAEAVLSGVYVATHGTSKYRFAVRNDLETNKVKRVWLNEFLGTEKDIRCAMEFGVEWQALIQCLPSMSGCQAFVTGCIRSKDPLVRRLGLYCGYWIPSINYWELVKQQGAGDQDTLTRWFALYLQSLQKQKTSRAGSSAPATAQVR